MLKLQSSKLLPMNATWFIARHVGVAKFGIDIPPTKLELIFLSLGWCCKIWNKSTLVIMDVACFISHHVGLAKFGTNSPWSSRISWNWSSPHYIGGEKLTLISTSLCRCWKKMEQIFALPHRCWKIKIDLHLIKCTNNIPIIIIGVQGYIHSIICLNHHQSLGGMIQHVFDPHPIFIYIVEVFKKLEVNSLSLLGSTPPTCRKTYCLEKKVLIVRSLKNAFGLWLFLAWAQGRHDLILSSLIVQESPLSVKACFPIRAVHHGLR